MFKYIYIYIYVKREREIDRDKLGDRRERNKHFGLDTF
jgi:hypothetical protein